MSDDKVDVLSVAESFFSLFRWGIRKKDYIEFGLVKRKKETVLLGILKGQPNVPVNANL